MKFKIQISDKMTHEDQNAKILRIPRDLRSELGISIGETIDLGTKDGSLIKLNIGQAFIEDKDTNSRVAFVSKLIFDVLEFIDNEEKNPIPLVNDITLGADPEYFLLKKQNHNIVTANSFFGKYGAIGYDGILAEIRPEPHTCEEGLTNNIKGLLQKAKNIISTHKTLGQDTTLVAKSHHRGVVAGFHLHYGIISPALLAPNYNYNVLNVIIEQIVRVLDYYLGIPSIIPEGIEDSSRRCAPFTSYGKAGDYRVDHRTLEYRVPGGHLLRHPNLTKGLIGLGAAVIEDIISRIKVCSDNFDLSKISNINEKDLYPNILSKQELIQTIGTPDTKKAKDKLDSIYKDVSSMVSYGKRKETIDLFFSVLEEKYSCYIEDNWQLK